MASGLPLLPPYPYPDPDPNEWARISTADHWRGPYTALLSHTGSQLLLAAADVGCAIEDYNIWFDTYRSP